MQLYTIQMPDGSYAKHNDEFRTVRDLNDGVQLEPDPWAELVAKKRGGKKVPVKIVKGKSR